MRGPDTPNGGEEPLRNKISMLLGFLLSMGVAAVLTLFLHDPLTALAAGVPDVVGLVAGVVMFLVVLVIVLSPAVMRGGLA